MFGPTLLLLTDVGTEVPHYSVLSLIHVKAANSDSNNRGISVSAYAVVCSQALKNLR
jgi:hypothetical protein